MQGESQFIVNLNICKRYTWQKCHKSQYNVIFKYLILRNSTTLLSGIICYRYEQDFYSIQKNAFLSSASSAGIGGEGGEREGVRRAFEASARRPCYWIPYRVWGDGGEGRSAEGI